MRKLILIKHARPAVEPRVPSDQWRLGPDGRAACAPLADALRPLAPAAVFSSVEPKARETADLLAAALGLSPRTAGNLHEHDRSNVPHLDTREFISSMAQVFREPGRLVLGRETADQACTRFAAAIDSLLKATPGDLAVVTHGTVIALFAHRRAAQDPFTLWRAMGQPSFLVLDADTGALLDRRDRI